MFFGVSYLKLTINKLFMYNYCKPISLIVFIQKLKLKI